MPELQRDLFEQVEFNTSADTSTLVLDSFTDAGIDHRSLLPDELPAGYYLRNFETLLGFVQGSYPHLLSTSEKQLIHDFFGLDDNAKKLFVRLSNRKGPYFRVDRLDYDDIDIAVAIESLQQAGLLNETVPGIEVATGLCTREELQALLPSGSHSNSNKKSLLVERCLAEQFNPLEHSHIRIVEPLRQTELMIIRLLFFGNFRQDMTEFVLGELVAPYEQYELSGAASPFPDRDVVNQMVFLQQISEISREAIEVDTTGDLLEALLAILPERPGEQILNRRFDRVVNRIARQLERLERPVSALEYYGRSVATPARERRARLLDRLSRPDEAHAICIEIIETPLDDDELDFALRFGARIAKKHDLAWPHEPVPDLSSITQSTIQLSPSDSSVEIAAAAHFDELGHDAWYVENALFRSLFGLTFWDVIFSPVPGAFFNPFQRAPADIHTPDFYHSRRDLIDRRLDDILQGRMTDIVAAILQTKRGIANQFVHWSALDDVLLTRALGCVPARHYHAIFSRLVRDVRDNCSGFPDLILFSEDAYQLVEVKGPGDKLQKNQTRWFHYFRAHDIPATVVNVAYTA